MGSTVGSNLFNGRHLRFTLGLYSAPSLIMSPYGHPINIQSLSVIKVWKTLLDSGFFASKTGLIYSSSLRHIQFPWGQRLLGLPVSKRPVPRDDAPWTECTPKANLLWLRLAVWPPFELPLGLNVVVPLGEEEEEPLRERERDMYIPVGNVKYWLGHGEREIERDTHL